MNQESIFLQGDYDSALKSILTDHTGELGKKFDKYALRNGRIGKNIKRMS